MEAKEKSEILIYVIGCPGAGKGTFCSMLASEYNWGHISIGNELRAYVQSCDQVDDVAAECVRSAMLVPVEQLTQIIGNRIKILRDQKHSCIILDGFPRRADQIPHMQETIGMPDRVIFMDCPKEIAKQRVLTRNVTGRVDNEEIFEKRFAEFQMNNPDILGYFEAQHKLDMIDTRFETAVSYDVLLELLQSRALPPHLFDQKLAR